MAVIFNPLVGTYDRSFSLIDDYLIANARNDYASSVWPGANVALLYPFICPGG